MYSKFIFLQFFVWMSSVDHDAVAYAEHAKKTSRSEVERAQIEKSRKDDIQGNKSSIKKN